MRNCDRRRLRSPASASLGAPVRALAASAVAAVLVWAPSGRAWAGDAPAGFVAAITDGAPVPLRLDTPSGRPVPRFVSMKYRTTNCRAGPTFEHPVRFTFIQRGAPALVVAETIDHWRKLRDVEGDECWAHRSVLRGPTHAYARRATALRVRPRADAAERAVLAPRAMAKIEKRRGDWVRVGAGARAGWARADDFWGVEPPVASAVAPAPMSAPTSDETARPAGLQSAAAHD
ncbi:MAG: SH3 domain-containing protein [Pseudomonadota bacterium]